MAGESDPPLASSTTNDGDVMVNKSPIISSICGAEEAEWFSPPPPPPPPPPHDSNDNKNGANEDTTYAENDDGDASPSLMGAVTNNYRMNNSQNVVASNDNVTTSDHPPPSASLEATSSEKLMMTMAASASAKIDAADNDQQQVSQQQHTQEEGYATVTKIPNAEASDDSSNTHFCSDAFTITSTSDTAASLFHPDEMNISDDNISKIRSSNDNTDLVTMKNSERNLQLLEILNHRRQLLTWVRTCRKQTQIMYEEMSRSSIKEEAEPGEPQQRQRRRRGLIAKLSSSNMLQEGGESSGTATSPTQLGGDGGIIYSVKSEISAYQTITDMTNRNPNSLKRSRPSSSSSVNENNHPRDLRRGPYVGKSFDAIASSSSSVIHGGAGDPATIDEYPSVSASALSNLVRAQSSSSNVHNYQGKQFQKLQPPYGGVPTPSSMLLNHASSSTAVATSNTKQKKSKKRKANSIVTTTTTTTNNNNNNNNNFTNHDRMGSILPFGSGGHSSHLAMTNKIDAALAASSTSQKRGMVVSYPNNNCTSTTALVPSAVAVNLLGMRNGLMAKLNSLLSGQKSKKQRCSSPTNRNEAIPSCMAVDRRGDDWVDVTTANDSDGNCSMPSMTGEQKLSPSVCQLTSSTGEKIGIVPPKHSTLSEDDVARQPSECPSQHQHHQHPLRLPIRRKTHWDCILEEMKWLAADFHEERKWKIAAGQTLSASVRKYKPKKKLSTSSLMGITPTKMSQISRSGSIISSSSRSRTVSINSFSLHTSESCIYSNDCNSFDPLFADASIEDVQTVKVISRLLSVGILEYWDSISSSRHHDYLNAREQRFHRLVELESLGNDTVKLVKSMESKSYAQVGATSLRSRDDESLQSSNSTGAIRELRFDEISSRIESSIELVTALKGQAANPSSKITSYGGIIRELDQWQLQTVHFVESLWATSKISQDEETEIFNNDARNSIAAIVGGSFGVGKTVAVCTLTWRNKLDGPQMIVCSPCAVIRWMHELGKFDDLNYRLYSRGDSCVASSFKALDVVVCDYGSLYEFVERDDQCLPDANFASMFLDLRHWSSGATRDIQIQGGDNHCPKILPSPLDSVKWWVCLNNFISKCPTSMKRLVIEQSDYRHNRFVVPFDGDAHVESNGVLAKRFHKLIAMKVAFVFHPSTFVSERVSVGKRVILWAKYQSKINPPAHKTPTGAHAPNFCNRNGPLPSRRWSSVLTASLQNLCYFQSNTNHTNCDDSVDIDSVIANFSWKQHTCAMGKSQQAAYNKSFACMRGNSDEAIAYGLMELRKACMYSTLDQITASFLAPLRWHTLGNRIVRKEGFFICTSSATYSEPSIELARKIMKQSSKMKELLRILVTEDCIDAASKVELVETLLPDGDDNSISVKKQPKKKVKLLILATLVQAQLLASSFLSALGLHHEVLLCSETNGNSSPHSSSNPSRSVNFPSFISSSESEYSWAWCQEVLCRFNDICAERSIDILISSPITISSIKCGLGVANADLVISIDEDWSGREVMHINSIVSKIYRAHLRAPTNGSSSLATTSRFIKLVCLDTCEHSFLCKGNTHNCLVRTVKSKIDTLKKCKVGTRRSSRQSSRTTKLNQHDSVDDIENDNKLKKTSRPCPTQAMAYAASINIDGFVVPHAKCGNGLTYNTSVEQHFVGANILRYRNSKLSAVFYVRNPGSDLLFLPISKCLNHSEVVPESDLAFAWALFDAEDRAAVYSTIPTSNLPGFECNIYPIASSPTSAIFVDGTSVQRYVESFKRSISFIPLTRSSEPIRLRDCRRVSGEGIAPSTDSTTTYSSTDICRTSDIFDRSNADLLVYSLPNDVAREREISAGDFDPCGEELAPNIFSFCYSVLDTITPTAIEDGTEGCESLVYFPSFFPYLLQESEKLVHTQSARDETYTATKVTKFNELPASSRSDFAFTIETNPHAFCRGHNKAGNEELLFHRTLLLGDVQNSTSNHSDLSLKSMILISQKKRSQHKNILSIPFELAGPILPESSRRSSDGDGKNSIHKRTKKQQHQHISSSARDNGVSYFHHERLLEQFCSARGNISAPNMGQIRVNCRLNDLVSNSFCQSVLNQNMPQSDTTFHERKLNESLLIGRNTRPVLIGAIPPTKEELTLRKNKYRSGIILPVGVKIPRMAMPLSSSLEDSPEPWTTRDDSILKGCVARYGMNWHLIAHAVSSGMQNLRKATRRSAVQCQNRWDSLECKNSNATAGASKMYNDTFAAASEIPLFVTKVEGMQRESIIFDRSFPSATLELVSDQNGATDKPRSVHGLQLAEEKNSSYLLARLQNLKEASLKRNAINIPLPSSMPTHPSHLEAIQAARASMLSAANVAPNTAPPRHEMWPLELLDFRKQHTSEHASLQSPHRHQTSMPHHVPHIIHSTQPQMMYHEAGQIPPPHQLYRHPQQQGNAPHGPGSVVQAAPPRTQRHPQ